MKTITLTNKGYLPYTDNLLKSIKKNSSELKPTICVMDNYSENYYKKKNYDVYLVDNLNNKKFLKQDSKEFGSYMISKIKIINYFLSNNEKILYMDGDIVVKNNFLNYLNKKISNKDMLIQNDFNPEKPEIEYLCAGFMAIKSNDKTLDFFNLDNIPTEKIMTGLHDQGYINENKELLNYEILPLDLFPNGPHYYNNKDSIDPNIIHFNYVVGNKKKKLMKKYGEWYL